MKTPSGATEILFQSLVIDENGLGRATPGIGLSLVSSCNPRRRKAADFDTIGVNATSWTAAASLLALGLSVGQAMGVIVGASLFAGVLAVVAGWMGSHHYVGFTILSRAYAFAPYLRDSTINRYCAQIMGDAWRILAGFK
jgi:hypothetical protein